MILRGGGGSSFSRSSVFGLRFLGSSFSRHPELDTSSITAKRKKPYIDLILDLIGDCTCHR